MWTGINEAVDSIDLPAEMSKSGETILGFPFPQLHNLASF